MEHYLSFGETTEADLPWVLAMESQADNKKWIIPYDAERHVSVIQNTKEFHFAVSSEGRPVGFIILGITSVEHNSMELRRIVVDKKGSGIGRMALRWIKNYCFLQLGFHRLWLDVFLENHRALNLYLSEGFIREGMSRSCIFDQGVWRSLYQLSMLEEEFEKFMISKRLPIEK